MSGSNCSFLTCIQIFQEAAQVVWYFHLLKNFPQFVVIHTAKECSDYHTIGFISHTSKAMLKIPQAMLQQYMNHELPDVQAGFRKCRGVRYQIANVGWISKKQEFQKNIYFCFIDFAKAFDCVDHNKLENS